MPPSTFAKQNFQTATLARLLTVSACLLLGSCVFLAVHAVKKVTDKEEPKTTEVRSVSASPDGIVLEAASDPITVAAKHCAAFGKVATQTGVQPPTTGKLTTYTFACRPKPSQ